MPEALSEESNKFGRCLFSFSLSSEPSATQHNATRAHAHFWLEFPNFLFDFSIFFLLPFPGSTLVGCPTFDRWKFGSAEQKEYRIDPFQRVRVCALSLFSTRVFRRILFRTTRTGNGQVLSPKLVRLQIPRRHRYRPNGRAFSASRGPDPF